MRLATAGGKLSKIRLLPLYGIRQAIDEQGFDTTLWQDGFTVFDAWSGHNWPQWITEEWTSQST